MSNADERINVKKYCKDYLWMLWVEFELAVVKYAVKTYIIIYIIFSRVLNINMFE